MIRCKFLCGYNIIIYLHRFGGYSSTSLRSPMLCNYILIGVVTRFLGELESSVIKSHCSQYNALILFFADEYFSPVVPPPIGEKEISPAQSRRINPATTRGPRRRCRGIASCKSLGVQNAPLQSHQRSNAALFHGHHINPYGFLTCYILVG